VGVHKAQNFNTEHTDGTADTGLVGVLGAHYFNTEHTDGTADTGLGGVQWAHYSARLEHTDGTADTELGGVHWAHYTSAKQTDGTAGNKLEGVHKAHYCRSADSSEHSQKWGSFNSVHLEHVCKQQRRMHYSISSSHHKGGCLHQCCLNGDSKSWKLFTNVFEDQNHCLAQELLIIYNQYRHVT
jgi:hypothetical protein